MSRAEQEEENIVKENGWSSKSETGKSRIWGKIYCPSGQNWVVVLDSWHWGRNHPTLQVLYIWETKFLTKIKCLLYMYVSILSFTQSLLVNWIPLSNILILLNWFHLLYYCMLTNCLPVSASFSCKSWRAAVCLFLFLVNSVTTT